MVAPYNIGLTVGANIDPLRKDLRNAQNEISGFASKTAATLKTAAAGFAIVGAAALAAGGALVKLSADSAAWADDISNLSKRAGTSAESFQELAFAARSLGIEQNKLSDIFRNSQKNLGEFTLTGGGPLKKFFDDVIHLTGMTAESFRDLSGPQGLQKFYDGLVAAKLPQDQIISQLEKLAAGSSDLIPLLQDGGRGFADLAKNARDAGVIISEDAVSSLASLDDQFQLVTEAAKSVGHTLASALSPEVSAFTNLMTAAAAETTSVLNTFIEWRKQRSAANDLEDQTTKIIENQSQATREGTIVQQAAAAAINDRIKENIELRKEQVQLEGRLRMATETYNMSEQKYAQDRLKEVGAQIIENEKMNDFLRQQSVEAQQILDLHHGITAALVEQNEVAAQSPAVQAAKTSAMPMDEFQNFVKDPFEAADPAKNPTMDMFDMGDEDPFATQQELFQKHWEEMNRIAVAGAGGVAQEIASRWGNAAGSTAAAGKSMFESFSQSSRKMFEVNKAWGIADAIVSTAQGIAAGVKLGWPMGIPAVAWAVANGAAQISRIRATQFGAGGGAPTATSAAPQGQSAPGTNAQGGQTERGGTLRIEGFNPDSLYSGSTLQGMANALEEFWNDGGGKGRVIFAGSQK
jgi:hypothetical protein